MNVAFDESTGLYRSGNLAVSSTLTPDLIGRAYYRLLDDGLAESVYYEGLPGIVGHLSQFTAPGVIILGAFADRTSKGKNFDFCGLSWVLQRQVMDGGRLSKAEVGFAFFRHCASPQEKVDFGKLMLYALFGRYNIDVLIGTTPVDNKAALKYSEQVGFALHGPIDNFVCWEGSLTGVYVSSLTREQWLATQRPDVDVSQERAA